MVENYDTIEGLEDAINRAEEHVEQFKVPHFDYKRFVKGDTLF